jgi:hypothetical protein
VARRVAVFAMRDGQSAQYTERPVSSAPRWARHEQRTPGVAQGAGTFFDAGLRRSSRYNVVGRLRDDLGSLEHVIKLQDQARM